MALISILAAFAFMVGLAIVCLAISLAVSERAWRSVTVLMLLVPLMIAGLGKSLDAVERGYVETIRERADG